MKQKIACVYLIENLIQTEKFISAKHLFSWSKKDTSADLFVKTEIGIDKTKLEGVFKKKTFHIEIPFSDNASIENAIHIWAFLFAIGLQNFVNSVSAVQIWNSQTI